jgi:protein-S-isoprenylcysteine O-methyltransferase Ste14
LRPSQNEKVPDLRSSAALTLPHQVMFYALVACWWVFGLTFWLRKPPARGQETTRDRSSLLGLALQSAGYVIIWFYPLQRRQLSPPNLGSQAADWGLAAITVLVAIGSVWLVNSAARRLGKQWALTARVLEGHTLIQDGPYRFVRNPIYTGMLGLLLATGLASGRWISLFVAVALFLAGTYIRVRSEEKLLGQVFGPEFEAYKRKVPALIPGIY